MMRLSLWQDGYLIGDHDERGDEARVVSVAASKLAERWPTVRQSAWVAVSDEDGRIVAEVMIKRL